VLLLVVLTAVTTYGFGLFLSAVVLSFTAIRNVASNVSYLTMAVICGVAVPTTYWPAPVQYVAAALPLTHTLRALRELAGGRSGSDVVCPAMAGLAVGIGWVALAAIAFHLLVRRGTRRGDFDFTG
jgi:ABC-2 type transport system permease protein